MRDVITSMIVETTVMKKIVVCYKRRVSIYFCHILGVQDDDCGSSSDEENCDIVFYFLHYTLLIFMYIKVGVHDSHTSCSSDDNGHCVPCSTKCNDYYDCVDGSDEDNCAMTINN